MGMLERKLSSFFTTFAPTLELIDDLIRERAHAQEIIILTCSRLDALASTAKPEDTPKKEAFVSFVCDYGQDREFFEKVSIGDLYRELAYSHWLVKEEILMQHGRFYRSSSQDDPVLRFIDYSDMPFDDELIKYMLGTIMKALSVSFRVKPGQSLAKSHLASAGQVLDAICSYIKHTRLKVVEEKIMKSIEPLVRAKTAARVLYDEFRSEVIHGGHVQIDEKKFFGQKSPYWTPYYSDYYGAFYRLEFPARFLRSLIECCIETYKHHLIVKGVVPAGIHWLVFGENSGRYLRLMDENSYDEYTAVRLRLKS